VKHGNGLKRLQIYNRRFLRSVTGITVGQTTEQRSKRREKYEFYINPLHA
jgi:hypothetical protein